MIAGVRAHPGEGAPGTGIRLLRGLISPIGPQPSWSIFVLMICGCAGDDVRHHLDEVLEGLGVHVVTAASSSRKASTQTYSFGSSTLWE